MPTFALAIDSQLTRLAPAIIFNIKQLIIMATLNAELLAQMANDQSHPLHACSASVMRSEWYEPHKYYDPFIEREDHPEAFPPDDEEEEEGEV